MDWTMQARSMKGKMPVSKWCSTFWTKLLIAQGKVHAPHSLASTCSPFSSCSTIHSYIILAFQTDVPKYEHVNLSVHLSSWRCHQGCLTDHDMLSAGENNRASMHLIHMDQSERKLRWVFCQRAGFLSFSLPTYCMQATYISFGLFLASRRQDKPLEDR